jgi:hypothetical protein
VLLQFIEVRRNPSASLRATQVAGLVYIAFGFGVLALTREPFAALFIVPGLVLAAASWGRP